MPGAIAWAVGIAGASYIGFIAASYNETLKVSCGTSVDPRG